MTALATSPKLQFLDSNGAPLVGGKLYTYAAGTTTPQVTYTDYVGGTPNANPVILDSRGEASVWLGTALYKMALYSATNVLIWTVDNIGGFATLAQLAASGGSNLVGFLQAGTGAVATTVQSKLRESVSVFDFMTAAAIANVQAGTPADCSAAVAIAYTYAKATGGELFFPAGTYLGQFDFNGEAPVRGAGQRRTTLKPSNTASYCVRLFGSGGDANLGATLSNLSITSTTKTGTGLLCGNAAGSGFSNGLVERLEISGFQDNWLLNSAIMCTFRAIWSKDGTYGLRADTENNITTCHFDTCRITTNDFGIKLEAGIVLKFTNCNSESNKFKNLWLFTSITQGPTRVTFDECWFEDLTAGSGTRYSVHLDMQSGIAATKSMSVLFNRCVITSPVGLVDVRADYAQDVIFDHCAFSAGAGTYTSTKFEYATGTNAVRVYLKDCGTVQLAPTVAMYASFPALTAAGGGTYGFFYEYTIVGGKQYANFEPIAEKGTFTPAVEGTSTVGVGTYSVQAGFYTKVGNRVFFNLAVSMSAHTGTGNMRIIGLPFTSSATADSSSYVTIAGGNLTFSGQLTAQVIGNGTKISILSFSSGASIAAVAMDVACDLRLSGFYMID
jgi:hypothetical protein